MGGKVLNRPLEQLRNLGPKSAALLRAAGIADETALRQAGPVGAYRAAKAHAPREVSVNMLTAIAGALLDCPWNELPPGIKEELLGEFGRPRRR